MEIDNLTNYKSIVVLIYYGETEYYAAMSIPVSLFKSPPIAPFYPSYHNGTSLFKGRIDYVDDTHVLLVAPSIHGIKVIGCK